MNIRSRSPRFLGNSPRRPSPLGLTGTEPDQSRPGRTREAAFLAILLLLFSHVAGAFAQLGVPEVEPNDTPVTATLLNLSAGLAVATSAIAPIGDLDYYSFVAPAGSKAWIYVDTGGTNGPDLDSIVALLASDGLTVLEDDDDDGSGNGCDDTLESDFASGIAGYPLTEGGTYYLRVGSYNDDQLIDGYQLFLLITQNAAMPEVEPNNVPTDVNPIVMPGTPVGLRAGAIGAVGDVDIYPVVAAAETILYISADCDPERDGGVNLVIDLLGTDKTTVLFSADSSQTDAGSAEVFCFKTTVAGTYYVRVENFGSGLGTYQLMVASADQTLLQFGAAAYSVLESESHLTIPIVRLGQSSGTVTAQVATSNRTASAAGDYGAFSQVLTFGNGVVTQFVSLIISNDLLPEINEQLLLTLSNPTGGAAITSPNSALVIILDDDQIDDNAPQTATALNLTSGFIVVSNSPASVPLALSPGGDIDWYSFTVPAGSVLWTLVDAGGVQAPEANSRDTTLTLYANDGTTVIEMDDDDGSGSGSSFFLPTDGGADSALAGRTLLSGGTYYLSVQAFSSVEIVNPYVLFVGLTISSPVSEFEPNENPGQANPLVTGSIPSGQRLGQISLAGETDLYSVVVPSNCLLYVSADCDPERNGIGTDLVVDLLAPDGSTVLFSADSSRSEPAAAESFAVYISSPGTYFVRARQGVGGGSGLYNIMAARQVPEVEPNDDPGTASGLDLLNQLTSAAGSIAPMADQDFYSVVSPPGAKLWVLVDTGGSGLSGATSRNSLLTVSPSGGFPVLEEDDDDGSGNGCDGTLESADASVIAGLSLDSGGNYDVRVKASGDAGIVNPYTLFAIVTTSAPLLETAGNDTADTATSLVAAAPSFGLRSGSLSAAGDVDYYSVVASAGNLLMIAADGDPERDGVGTDLRMELLSTDGTTILFSANSSTVGSGLNPAAEGFCYLIGNSGTYFVRVMHGGAGTGSYHLMVARDNTLLRITSFEIVGEDVRLSFPTEQGRNYQVERAEVLSEPTIWMPLGAPVAGNGRLSNSIDVGGAAGLQNFYRVRRLP